MKLERFDFSGGLFDMEPARVLIVSESPDRRNFLEYHVRSHQMTTVSYLNILAARKAVSVDVFAMVVVDLSIPVEPKLALVKEACHHQPGAQVIVITLGKEDYLREKGSLSGLTSVSSIASIDSFPDKLGELEVTEGSA